MTQTRNELIDQIYEELKDKARVINVGAGRSDSTSVMVTLMAIKAVLKKMKEPEVKVDLSTMKLTKEEKVLLKKLDKVAEFKRIMKEQGL